VAARTWNENIKKNNDILGDVGSVGEGLRTTYVSIIKRPKVRTAYKYVCVCVGTAVMVCVYFAVRLRGARVLSALRRTRTNNNTKQPTAADVSVKSMTGGGGGHRR